jgi:hypothetical protein
VLRPFRPHVRRKVYVSFRHKRACAPAQVSLTRLRHGPRPTAAFLTQWTHHRRRSAAHTSAPLDTPHTVAGSPTHRPHTIWAHGAPSPPACACASAPSKIARVWHAPSLQLLALLLWDTATVRWRARQRAIVKTCTFSIKIFGETHTSQQLIENTYEKENEIRPTIDRHLIR